MTSTLRRLGRAYRTAWTARRDARQRPQLAAACPGFLIIDVDALLDSGEPPIGDGYLYLPIADATRS